MRIKSISEKRQRLIDAKNKSPLQTGERINVFKNALTNYPDPKHDDSAIECIVIGIDGDAITVESKEYRHKETKTIKKADIKSRDLYKLGANPFEEGSGEVRCVPYSFDSILFNLDILEEKSGGIDKYDIKGVPIKQLNWNPYVFTKSGEKQFYQRGWAWDEYDAQLLIESIYQGIDCGKILVRKRSFEEIEVLAAKGEKELAFNDLVDGKQRLNAVKRFLLGEFADLNGNYFGDLSWYSQHKLTNNQLFSFAEMPEDTKDEAVLKQFLKMNHAGAPQSPEHILFVKELLKKT